MVADTFRIVDAYIKVRIANLACVVREVRAQP